MMDFNAIGLPEQAVIHLEFPGIGKLYDDEKKTKPVEIVVWGPTSPAAMKHQRQVTRKFQSEYGKKGQRALRDIDPEEAVISKLVAYTAEVRNLKFDGEYVTAETVRKVYEAPNLLPLREQVLEKIASYEDFLA